MPSNLPHVIGVDIGTTSTKAVVFDLEGKVKATIPPTTRCLPPAPGIAEQDPDEIFRATLNAIRGGGVHAAGSRLPTSKASASVPPCTASSPSMTMAGR
ncbi:MAG: FGGY family carbohydrate kinase [Rhodospirillales bacterium]